MQPHQQRVVEEKKELDEKRAKLLTFLASDTFRDLDEQEKIRLHRQLGVMGDYSMTLGERIRAFQFQEIA